MVRKQRQESVTVSSEGREVRERMLKGWSGQGMEVWDEDGSVVGSGPGSVCLAYSCLQPAILPAFAWTLLPLTQWNPSILQGPNQILPLENVS